MTDILNTINRVSSGASASLFGLSMGQKSFVASSVSAQKLLYIVADQSEQISVAQQLRAFYAPQEIVLLPPDIDILTYSLAISTASPFERIRAIYSIVNNSARVIVATLQSLVEKFPKPEIFKSNVLNFSVNHSYDTEKILKQLVYAGYRRNDLVEAQGQFSSRGDIIDIFAINHTKPVRLSFFANELEQIKYFDAATQKSNEHIESVDICPATTIFMNGDSMRSVLKKINSAYNDSALSTSADIKIRGIIDDITTALDMGARDLRLKWIEPFIEPLRPLAAYFSQDDLVVFDEPRSIVNGLNSVLKEFKEQCHYKCLQGGALSIHKDTLFDMQNAFSFNAKCIAFHKNDSQNNIFKPDIVYSQKGVAPVKYSRDFSSLCFDILHWLERGFEVVLACQNPDRTQAILRTLIDANTPAIAQEYDEGKRFSDYNIDINNIKSAGYARLLPVNLDFGFIFGDLKLIVLGSDELGLKKQRRALVKNTADLFSELKAGELAVHFVHGVGRFEGVVRMGNPPRDYFELTYADNAKLFVPIENMDSLYRFSQGGSQKLNKLGGADFDKVKARVKKSVKQLAFDLLELYAKRHSFKNQAIDIDQALFKMFEDSFQYTETPDQLRAIADIKTDFCKDGLMDRLICGDVGFGKTEVALRAAFAVMSNGCQVALLAPTTILAEQHFDTANQRFSQFGLKCACLTRFRTSNEVKEILRKLKDGEIDFVCGTHRLLSKDVSFQDLKLLILDEEQRFGVADKEKIKLLKTDIHVLTMSATPIPRTLHMSLSGIRDISLIDTPPEGRIEPQIYVTEFSQSLVHDAVTRELNRFGQAFIVYNCVEKIEDFANKLRSILPDAKIIVAHGQMPERQLEAAIDAFYNKKASVLLCSTIIENGIDLPSVNTMIVCDADRLGLSQLYQLKGRVGRGKRSSFVYFTYPEDKILTENAYKRLDTIEQFTEFGSGHKIAMRDLEIRGAGNVLGSRQHGHIEEVGYELYMKLLNDAVTMLKDGVDTKEQIEVRVQTDQNSFIPESFVEAGGDRIRLYKKISTLKKTSEVQQLINELTDIYGNPPKEVINLLEAALIKNLAANVNAKSVSIKQGSAEVFFEKLADLGQRVLNNVSSQNGCVLRADKKPSIYFEGKGGKQKMIDFLVNFGC